MSIAYYGGGGGGGGSGGEAPVITPKNWDDATLLALKAHIRGAYNFGEAPVDDGGVDKYPNLYQGAGAWAGMRVQGAPGANDQYAFDLANGLPKDAGGGCVHKRSTSFQTYMEGPAGDYDIGTDDYTAIQFFYCDYDYGTGGGTWCGFYVNNSNRLCASVYRGVFPRLVINGNDNVANVGTVIYGGLNMLAVGRRASESFLYLNGVEVTGARANGDANTGNLTGITSAPYVNPIEQVYFKGHGATKAELDAVHNNGQMTFWRAAA